MQRNRNMLRRALLLWVLTLGSIPAFLAVSSSGLGLSSGEETFIDNRLPTVSGCFGRSRDGSENTWTQELCTFGASASDNRLLIVGDSTVASMTDGVVAAAADWDVGVVAFPSRGCTFTSRFPHSYEWCRDYFQESVDLIKRIKPIGVIVSNYLSRMDLSDRRIPLMNGELPQSREQRLESTIDSLNEALLSIFQIMPEIPILIVQEVPTIPFRQPSVLFDKSAFPTVDTSSRSYLRQRTYMNAVEKLARTFSSVSILNPHEQLCRESICSAKSPDGMWLYMDGYHLNPRGSKLLTGQFRDWLRSVVS